MQEQQYAGFWIRTFATIIDSVLVILLMIPLMMMLGLGESSQIFSPMDIGINLLIIVATIIFWITKGATPGKMVTKVKIVDANTGGELSVGQSVIRYIGYIIGTIPLLLGFFWIAFDKKKQGWHDKMAGTVVIKND